MDHINKAPEYTVEKSRQPMLKFTENPVRCFVELPSDQYLDTSRLYLNKGITKYETEEIRTLSRKSVFQWRQHIPTETWDSG